MTDYVLTAGEGPTRRILGVLIDSTLDEARHTATRMTNRRCAVGISDEESIVLIHAAARLEPARIEAGDIIEGEDAMKYLDVGSVIALYLGAREWPPIMRFKDGWLGATVEGGRPGPIDPGSRFLVIHAVPKQ